MDEPSHTVVIDNGSCTCKAGFAGNDSPTAVFPTITGKPRYQGAQKNLYVGDEAFSKRGILDIDYPVQRGLITNWDSIEKIWDHIFREELNVDSKDCLVIVADPPCGPSQPRRKMTEIMFEKFEVAEFYVCLQACLALYASGLTTGMVLDSGDEVTHAVPIYEGYALPHAIKRLDFAGRELTDYLMKMLNASDHSFSTIISEHETVRDMKERCCYISTVEQQSCASASTSTSRIDVQSTYKLPDGSEVKLGDEQFQCPECLFKPSLCVGKDLPGIQDIVHQSIIACADEADLEKRLYQNVILTGGSTCFSGLPERLKKELETLSYSPKNVRVECPNFCKYGAWRGGSILGSLRTYRSMWITKAEYEEEGPDIVHRKCQ